MATTAPPLPPGAPAGVATAPARRRRASTVAALLIALVVAGLTFALLQANSSPAGSQGPAPAPAAAPAFDVTVASVEVDSLDNAELFGNPPSAPASDVTDAAVTGASAALARYLDAQFANAETRFSAAPLANLLTDAARARLTPEAERGLGVLPQPPADVRPGAATADFRVLASPDGVTAVTVEYTAAMGALTQHGSAVFVPVADAWRVDAVDVVLEATQ